MSKALGLLADQINDAHRFFLNQANKTIGHARDLGALLAEAKEIVPHGEFEKWIEKYCHLGIRQARNYIRIHTEWDQIGTTGADLSIKAALQLLTDERDTETGQNEATPSRGAKSSDGALQKAVDSLSPNLQAQREARQWTDEETLAMVKLKPEKRQAVARQQRVGGKSLGQAIEDVAGKSVQTLLKPKTKKAVKPQRSAEEGLAHQRKKHAKGLCATIDSMALKLDDLAREKIFVKSLTDKVIGHLNEARVLVAPLSRDSK